VLAATLATSCWDMLWCAWAWTYLECSANDRVAWTNNQGKKYKYNRSDRGGRKSTVETWTTWTKKLLIPEKVVPPSSLSQQSMLTTTRTTVRQSTANQARRSHRSAEQSRVCRDEESSHVPAILSVYESSYEEYESAAAVVVEYAPSFCKDIAFVDDSGMVDFPWYEHYMEENNSSSTDDNSTDLDVPLDRFVQRMGGHLDAALADFRQRNR
jgi:hypothetical protein